MPKKKQPLEFVDAQAMALLHPATFEAPDRAALAAIKPGYHIKVSTGDERFWVKVTEVDKTGDDLAFSGVVDNDLICTGKHGLKLGDLVRVSYRHVYNIFDVAAA